MAMMKKRCLVYATLESLTDIAEMKRPKDLPLYKGLKTYGTLAGKACAQLTRHGLKWGQHPDERSRRGRDYIHFPSMDSAGLMCLDKVAASVVYNLPTMGPQYM